MKRFIASALLCLVLPGIAHAEERPPGCQNLNTTWVRGNTTEDQTGSFVSAPVEELGLKWASWKDGDQSLSINFMGGAWEGVMCMTSAKLTAPISLTCRIPGLTFISTKAPNGFVETMVCIPVPLPKTKVRPDHL